MSHAPNRIAWNGSLQQEAVDLLREGGNVIVSPTKVGYIILAVDAEGLARKFELKNRPLTKPSVVLCGSLDELRALAEVNDDVIDFYQTHWDQDVLLGCILPWKHESKARLSPDVEPFVTDQRGTSCFVVRFGAPAEHIARELWEKDGTILFASSANPSGQGNRGVVAGIGERIGQGADLVIEADEFVRGIQPSTDERYEQGVMVSFVDDDGELVPEQRGQIIRGIEGNQSTTPLPTLIRAGLSLDRILMNMATHFPRWNYRHGRYY